MSKINLNNFVEEQSIVFNDGVAGRVKNVSVNVRMKTPEDKPNAPDAKVIVTDQKGGTVNLGVYWPTEQNSEKEIAIRIDQLVKFLVALNPEMAKQLPEFETPNQAYRYLVQEINRNSKNGLVNVFVAYGTVRKPSTYLNFRAYNIVEPADTPDERTRLVPNTSELYADLMKRPEATENFGDEPSSEGSNAEVEQEDTITWGSES